MARSSWPAARTGTRDSRYAHLFTDVAYRQSKMRADVAVSNAAAETPPVWIARRTSVGAAQELDDMKRRLDAPADTTPFWLRVSELSARQLRLSEYTSGR